MSAESEFAVRSRPCAVPTCHPDPSVADPARLLHSADLFEGRREILIEHAGQRYRLLITRNDRLILQK